MKVKKTEFHVVFEEIGRTQALPPYLNTIIEAAQNQLSKCYNPYSKFDVTAALITDKKEIYLGNNQENASYPLCICAERVALYNFGAMTDKQQIKAIAIIAKHKDQDSFDPVSPCGACRQVLLEFEQKQENSFEIYLVGSEKIIKINQAKDLLPLSFEKSTLL